MTEREIWVAAYQCIQQQGQYAASYAAERASGLLAAGDLDSQCAWLRIRAAIKRLQIAVNCTAPGSMESA